MSRHNHLENGDHNDFQRYHQRRKDDSKQDFVPLEMVLGKCIAAHHIYHYSQKCGHKADKYRVEKVYAKVAFRHGLCVVIQRRILPQQAGRPGKQLADALKGRADHPDYRHQKQKGQNQKKNPFEPLCTNFLCFSLHPAHLPDSV